jgi:hypothetical protein
MKQEFELQLGETIVIDTDITDTAPFTVTTSEVWTIPHYKGYTLQDVLEEIDETPEDLSYIDIEEILAEIDWEDSYEELIEVEFSDTPLAFIREFLKRKNDYMGKEYGYENFYDVVTFDIDLEEGFEEQLAYLNQLIDRGVDDTGQLSDIVNGFEDNTTSTSYIICLKTEYEEPVE